MSISLDLEVRLSLALDFRALRDNFEDVLVVGFDDASRFANAVSKRWSGRWSMSVLDSLPSLSSADVSSESPSFACC